jgi:hypothetical protein
MTDSDGFPRRLARRPPREDACLFSLPFFSALSFFSTGKKLWKCHGPSSPSDALDAPLMKSE